MTLIHVPRPPKSAMDPHRPVNALLQAQMQHLQDAELKLPAAAADEHLRQRDQDRGRSGRVHPPRDGSDPPRPATLPPRSERGPRASEQA